MHTTERFCKSIIYVCFILLSIIESLEINIHIHKKKSEKPTPY